MVGVKGIYRELGRRTGQSKSDTYVEESETKS